MWNVRLYKRTGLNSVNVLDKPQRLSAAEFIDVPALDILQGEHLNEIRVKATRAQVKDVDFLSLTDTESNDVFYYAVDPFMKTSIDVTTLKITIDSVLTAAAITGDIKNVEFGDGMVSRRHVPKSEDTFGAFREPDPYLVPSKELAADVEYLFKNEVPVTQDNTRIVIESTLDLPAMSDYKEARTYTDADSGQSVTVPNVISVDPSMGTSVTLHNVQAATRYRTPGSVYFDYRNSKVRDGIKQARALGVEGGILNSYMLPENATHDANTNINADGVYATMQGEYLEQQSALPFEFAQAQNKRVLYGELCEYQLQSVSSGMSVSYRPEEITHGSESAPIFAAIFDPRPEGRPYYRSKYYRGVDTAAAAGGAFFGNAVAGSNWANAPLLYTGRSGSTLEEIRYNTDKTIRSNDVAAQQDLAWESLGRGLKNTGGDMIGNVVGNLIDGNFGEAFGAPISWMTRSKDAIEQQEIASAEITRRYKQTALKELEQFMIGQQVVKPDLHFPNSATLRDFIGNGLCVVRYRPSDGDITKLDKILNMYGYKDTVALDGNVFGTRSKFNYVMASGVSVTDKRLPLWLRETLAAQLNAGVRVWHQLPDANAYTDGSNT